MIHDFQIISDISDISDDLDDLNDLDGLDEKYSKYIYSPHSHGLSDFKNNDNGDFIAYEKLKKELEKEGLFKYAYAPRGFLMDYEDLDSLELFTTELKKYLKEKLI